MPTRVEFLSSPQAQRVPPRQPEQLRSHQKIDTHGSNDHACHRDCNYRFDEDNQVVDDRPVRGVVWWVLGAEGGREGEGGWAGGGSYTMQRRCLYR